MSTAESYLKALLALSGDEQLAVPRRHLLNTMKDGDVAELLTKVVQREFARGGLDDIVEFILNVIARDPAFVEHSDTTEARAPSFKGKEARGNDIQQHSGNEITVLNDSPTSGESVTQMQAGKRRPPYSSGSGIRKRSKLTEPLAVARPDTSSAYPTPALDDVPTASPKLSQKVTLKCQAVQVITDKHIPPIEIVRYVGDSYFQLTTFARGSLEALIVEKFDTDYLSDDGRIYEWERLVRLQKGLVSQRCVNETVVMRARQPGGRTGNMNEACDRCVRMKRLCARLVKIDEVTKLAFFPLPRQHRGDAASFSLSYWVRS